MNSTDEPTKLVVVPDLGDELLAVVNQVEELLLTLAIWEDEDGVVLPAPLAGRTALVALEAIYEAVAPTQSRYGRNLVSGRLLAPDGRYEHQPLRFVLIASAQLNELEHAAQVLAEAALGSDLEEGITQHAEDHQANRTEIVGSFSRLVSLLTLAWDDDVRVLWAAVKRSQPGTDVTLEDSQEHAYSRLATRINHLWSYGSPADRFLY
jgi:hypothetical protein